LIGGLVKLRSQLSIANANETTSFSDAELDAFMASIPVEGELVTV